MRRTLALALCSLAALAGCTSAEPQRCDDCSDPGGFAGLSADVDVRRDAQGIVHIYGQTDADVYYASGYAQAVDRLFQMDQARRRALGRRAEVVGEEAAGEDALIRRINIARMGADNAALVEQTAPDQHALLVAWTAGVNARIDEVLAGDQPLPRSFEELGYKPERWDVSDTSSVGKLALFANANGIEFEMLAALVEQYFGEITAKMPLFAPMFDAYILPPSERPDAGPPRSQPRASRHPSRALPADAQAQIARFVKRMRPLEPGASNNWAVDGRHTANGRPLLAGDPHRVLTSPSLLWAHHVNSLDGGGSIDVVGFSFVGSPQVQLGHNRDVAWTATTNFPDVMDLLDVPFDGSTVEIGGQAYDVVSRDERIEVAGSEPIDIVAEDVPGWGILLPNDLAPLPLVESGHRILLRWPGFEPTHDVQGFAEIASAASLDAFEAAVDSMEIANFNFIASSADGISYRSSMRVPDRQDRSAFGVLDGSDPKNLWSDAFLPGTRLPRSRGAERGWIASANNDPFGFTSDGIVEGDAWYFGMLYAPGARAARIESELERLVSDGAIDVADMQTLQMDNYSVIADELIPPLQEAWAAVANDDALAQYRDRSDLEQLVELIANWDRHMQRDSSAALAFHAFKWFAADGAIADDLGPVFSGVADAAPIYALKWGVMTLTNRFESAGSLMQEGRTAIILAALDATASFLRGRFGSSDPSAYTWGDYHRTRIRGGYGGAPEVGDVVTDGSDGSVNVSGAKFFVDGEPAEMHIARSGSMYRMVTEFDDGGTPRATLNYAPGNAGDPDSPYFDNAVSDWADGVYRPLLFDDAAIAADTRESFTLHKK